MFFYPSKADFANTNLDRYSLSHTYFTSTNGVLLHGIFLKPAVKSQAVILYLHGNALNINAHIDNVLWLVDAGFTVFAIDYRGYGKSEGSTDIDGVHADAIAALETLFTLCPEQKDKIIVFGQSLGGAIAVYTVANSIHKQNIRMLIVDSIFSGYRSIAREKISFFLPLKVLLYPLTFTINDFYSPVNWIDKIGAVPLLVLHGTNDPVVPADNSYKLFERAKMPKEIWSTDIPGHITFLSDEKNRVALIKYIQHRL